MSKVPILQRLNLVIEEMDKKSSCLTRKQVTKIPIFLCVRKPCVACLIIPRERQELRDGRPTRLQAMLLGRNTKTKEWEMFGGALLSAQETAMEQLFEKAAFDVNQEQVPFVSAFHHIQALSLLACGQMQPLTYIETVEQAAFREAKEEGWKDGIVICHLFNSTTSRYLPFAPTNPNIKAVLEKKLPKIYGKAPYAFQWIDQKFLLAELMSEGRQYFTPNEEIDDFQWFTMEEIVQLGEWKAGIRPVHKVHKTLRNFSLRNSAPLSAIQLYLGYTPPKSKW